MQARAYAAPPTLDDALALLAEHGADARVLAGGTDLIIQVRENRRDVGVMVDVKAIRELTEFTFLADGSLRIGAATPCARIYRDSQVARRFPAIIDSASLIGGVQIQSRASLGGNLCNSSPAADSIPTLIALGAIAEIRSKRQEREVPVEAFCTGPGQNVLAADELLVALHIPAPAAHSGAAFQRFIPRNEMDISVTNAAANITLSADGQTFTAARIAIGAVAPTPLLVPAAGAALVGQPVGEAAIEAAAAASRAAARPITDMRGSADQRRHLAGVLTARVLRTAIERARAS
ncbi:MAG: xanthine dehydrogenase family protein subunit M [Dehalococcoidia bacterium]